MDKILAIIATLLLISCSKKIASTYKTDLNDSTQDSLIYGNGVYTKILEIRRDTTFSCSEISQIYSGITFQYDKMSILEKPYLDKNASCFCKGSYNGNKNDIDILKLLHYNNDHLICSNYRGSDFFELVLKRSSNSNVINSANSLDGFFTNYQSGYRSRLFDMMKTIDKKKPDSYVITYLLEVLKLSENTVAAITLENGSQFDKYEYESTLHAWNNGLIILKEYGEE